MIGHAKWWGLFLILLPVIVNGSGIEINNHIDPVGSVILSVTALFFFAILGRYIAIRMHQPGVLGELLIGVVLGNLAYWYGFPLVVILREGSAIFHIMKELLAGTSLNQAVMDSIHDPTYAHQVIQALSSPFGVEYIKIAYIVDIFSRYGVIFLLFMVGLESSIDELKHTGRESLFVAVIGVIGPMVLGFAVAYWLMPEASLHTDLFVAATLSATSIGITARVLSEMNKLHTRESRTILGAAMLDDIFGLIILAIVSSIVIQGEIDILAVVRIIFYTLLFFLSTIFLGPILLRRAVHFFRFLATAETKLIVSVLFVMILAWFASWIQLAAIIGAFAAGVILHDGYFSEDKSRQNSIKQLVSPLESFLAPMFFILIGIQVKLEAFYNGHVLILAGGLLVAAIIGKLISGLGANRKDDKYVIGIGMLPRGEVGLVFASIGRTLDVISDDLFAAIVLMVVCTTFIAPPLLKARFAAKD